MKKENLEEELKETKEQVEKLKKINKKNNLLLVILICIVMIACGYGFGYVIGTQLAESENNGMGNEAGEKEEEKSNEKETDEEVKLDVNSVVVKELFEVFREDTLPKNYIWSNSSEYSDFEKKIYISYLSIAKSEFVTKKCGDLGATYAFDKTGFIYHCGTDFSDEAAKYYYESDWENFGKKLVNNTVLTISSDKLRTSYEKLYGVNSSYQDENLSLNYDTFLYYDKNSNSYAHFSCECGGEIGDVSQTLDSVIHEGTSLKLNTTLTDGESTKEIIYTFEYEKETGNYIFVSRTEK